MQMLVSSVSHGLSSEKCVHTNYVNDVKTGMVLLYKPVYKSYDYESYNSKFLIIMA